MNLEAQFLQQLPRIEQTLRSICRRQAFPPDESEEFASWAKVRLIEDDYAVLRRFRGEALLSTYLVTVLHNLFLDYRAHRWGKWRPSALAKRLGTEAVQLETLLYRDGNDLATAIRLLRQRFGVDRGDEELARLASRLPPRSPRRFESSERLEEKEGVADAGERLEERDRTALAERTERALNGALATLPARERLLLKLRFADGLSVAAIASALGEPAKPLYRRIERALAALRSELDRRGTEKAGVLSLVGWAGLDLRLDFEVERESPQERPSHPGEQSA